MRNMWTSSGPMFTGVRAKCVEPRHNLSDFPIPDSGFPNSEFRMAYARSGIPHHEIAEPRGAHERHMSGRRGGVTFDVLGGILVG